MRNFFVPIVPVILLGSLLSGPGCAEDQAPAAGAAPQAAAASELSPLEKGMKLYRAQKYHEALAALKEVVRQDPKAQKALFSLAVMYDRGLGVPQNLAEAASLYRRAWQAGNAEAYERLKVLYKDATAPAGADKKAPPEQVAQKPEPAPTAAKIVLQLPPEALQKLDIDPGSAPKDARYDLVLSCDKDCTGLEAQAQEMAKELGATVVKAETGSAEGTRSAGVVAEEIKVPKLGASRKISLEDGATPDTLTVNVTCTGWCDAIKKVAQAIFAIFDASSRSAVASRSLGGEGAKAGVSDTRSLSAKLTQGKSYGLIVGINSYQHINKLKNAVNDAKVIDEVLRDNYGFETTVIMEQDATRDNIMKALNDLRKKLTENDSLVLFYSGHGEFNKETGTSYWLPVDAAIDDNTKWLEARSISDQLKLISAKHILVIADSCFSGTMTRASDVKLTQNSTRENFLNKLFEKPSRVLIASGGNEPVTDAGGQGHSIFSDALIRALKEPFAQVFTAEELMTRHLKESVAGRTEQTPEYKVVRNSGHDGGDFIFVKKK